MLLKDTFTEDSLFFPLIEACRLRPETGPQIHSCLMIFQVITVIKTDTKPNCSLCWEQNGKGPSSDLFMCYQVHSTGPYQSSSHLCKLRITEVMCRTWWKSPAQELLVHLVGLGLWTGRLASDFESSECPSMVIKKSLFNFSSMFTWSHQYI